VFRAFFKHVSLNTHKKYRCKEVNISEFRMGKKKEKVLYPKKTENKKNVRNLKKQKCKVNTECGFCKGKKEHECAHIWTSCGITYWCEDGKRYMEGCLGSGPVKDPRDYIDKTCIGECKKCNGTGKMPCMKCNNGIRKYYGKFMI